MPEPGKLAGRVALVTGGGRGIGRAIALALAREGADIAVAARTSGETERVAAEARGLGRRAAALTADVTSERDVAAMAAAAVRDLGRVDILVNAAGGAESAPLVRTDLPLWNRMLAANLTSVFLCTHAFLPAMIERGWGRVINVASRAGLTGFAYVSAYCAAKHGVVGFTRAVAQEVAGKGVTLNALCPGYVDTDMTRRSAESIALKTGMPLDQALARLAAFNPSGKLISPEQVAAAALSLASTEGTSINGEALEI
jgi:NAD(P)-dependent dehydrogenase (short-subunit alcohol dehydrogenase family)